MRVIALSFLILIVFWCNPCLSGWERSYGGPKDEGATAVLQTADGGFLLTGYTYSFGAGTSDIWVLRLNSEGDTVWTRTFGGEYEDFPNALIHTLDGDYLLVGWTRSFGKGSQDAWILKFTDVGDTVWTRVLGGTASDIARSVLQSPNGNFTIVGNTESFGADDDDLWVIRLDLNGDTLWTRKYGGPGAEIGHSVVEAPDEGYVIIGHSQNTPADSYDVFLLKLNSIGDLIWKKTYGGRSHEVGSTIALTSDSCYIAEGYTWTFGRGKSDFWIMKFDPHGDTLWTRTFGGKDWDYSDYIVQTAEGGYAVVGWSATEGEHGMHDVWLIKLDEQGRKEWDRSYGGPLWDWGTAIHQTSDGGYIIAGWTESFRDMGRDFYLIKTDSKGKL
ncbi:hypothetical protein JW877_06010 [bacterium]|nr:hypothetical protein [bacterium]